MRLVPLCLAAALAACGPPPPLVTPHHVPGYPPPTVIELTAEQVAAREREREFEQRRFALAATAIDDPPALNAALRQTAEWYLGPAPEDRSPAARRTREAAVVAEVARIRPIVEEAAQTVRASRAASRARDEAGYVDALAAILLDSPSRFPAELRAYAERLAGPSPARRTAASQAAWEASVREAEQRLNRRAELRREDLVSLRAVSATVQRDQQAEVICRARGQLRDQALPYRGLLNLENMIAGMQAARICMDTYRATGILPSY